MMPVRKNCTCCGRWLLCCINFYVAERNDDDTPKRLQSWCHSCQRSKSRVRNGRQRRGSRYNPQRKLTPEQDKRRRTERRNRRQTSKRKGDPLVPIKPLSEWLGEHARVSGLERVARRLDMDRENLKRYINQVQNSTHKTGRIERWLDIKLSRVEEVLMKFEEPLTSVYPPEHFPWLYEDHRPRSYPRGRQRRASS